MHAQVLAAAAAEVAAATAALAHPLRSRVLLPSTAQALRARLGCSRRGCASLRAAQDFQGTAERAAQIAACEDDLEERERKFRKYGV